MSVSLMLTNKSDRNQCRLIPVAIQQEFVEVWMAKCDLLGLRFVPMFDTGTVLEDDDIDFVIDELKKLTDFVSSSDDSMDSRLIKRAVMDIEELTKVKGRRNRNLHWVMLRHMAVGGKWDGGSSAHLRPGPLAAGDQVVSVIKVTAGGSVVHETLFPGQPHEMVSVYTVDGPDLIMTHYCVLGNQPRMKADPKSPANQIVWRYAGGSNLNPKRTSMHEATLTIVDDDHIEVNGIGWENGAPAKEMCCGLKLVRRK